MLDVVIVVFRPRLQELQAGLDALAQAGRDGLPISVHLWHNDDGPAGTPGLPAVYERLRAQGLRLQVTGGQGNLGFGRAINAVLPGVQSDFVLLLNQDAIPEPGALPRLWQVARNDDPSVVAWELRQIPYEHPKDYDPVTGDTGWCSGAAVLLRTPALRAVKGFEPRFFMYCEDVDLSWRLRCRGGRLRYVPRCAVVHHTYSEPGEIKPLAVLGGCYANLCLRTRYAGRRNVLEGVRQLVREIRGPQAFAGRRMGMVKALLKFVRHYAYFRRTRQAAPGFEPCLRGWDYEMRREGAFHPFLTQAEQRHPRPLVSVVLRPQDSADNLRDWFTSLDNQTHRPLQVLVVDDGSHDLAPIWAAFGASLDLVRVVEPVGVPLAEVAARHAQGDWVVLAEDTHHRLYADHVEVLLQAAIDQQATAACGLVWLIDAPAAQARAAHRLHAERRVGNEPAAERPSRLLHRATLAGGESRVAQVPKVTAVRYAADKA